MNRIRRGESIRDGAPQPPSKSIIELGNRHGGNPLALSSTDLSKHLLFVGASGCGKTNCLLEVARQLKSRMGPNDSMCIFDPKGDFVTLASPATDVLVSARGSSECWNIFGEITVDGWTEEDMRANASEIADTAFAESVDKSNNAFFPKGARDIFVDILTAMGVCGAEDKGFRKENLNNRKLREFISSSDTTGLRSFLGNVEGCSSSMKYLGDGTSPQALGLLAELQEVTNSLFLGDFGKTGAFSARRFERGVPAGTLFVEYDVARASSPAYQVIVDTYIKEALAKERNGSTYVLIDELKMLPRLMFLENALSFGRSQGVKVIAACQNIDQVYETYGECAGRSLVSGFQTVVCFGTNNEATRVYAKGLSGKRLGEVSYMSSSEGVLKSSLREDSLVDDGDFASMSVGDAFVFPGWETPYKFSFRRY